ncbi:hypothetical protein M885DRAFT_611002 [Pelagophyceae sp. CCMP2097]|nr:hypothetical protein M885DRAFT_611002 [Pelagophyceae sp. CCMP2097]
MSAVYEAVGRSTLVDFSWSCRVVMSSNKLAEMRNAAKRPIVLLQLDLLRPDGSPEHCVFELDKHQLGEFLDRLRLAPGES